MEWMPWRLAPLEYVPPHHHLLRWDGQTPRSHWGATGGATDGVWKALGSPLTGLMPERQGGRGAPGCDPGRGFQGIVRQRRDQPPGVRQRTRQLAGGASQASQGRANGRGRERASDDQRDQRADESIHRRASEWAAELAAQRACDWLHCGLRMTTPAARLGPTRGLW